MLKLSINLITIGLVLVGFSGCGAKEKQFSTFNKPAQGKGLLYVYRPSKFVGGGVFYDVKDESNNDAVVGNLTNGSFIKQQMTPGTKNIWAKTTIFKSETNVDIKDGEVSCIRGTVTPGLLIGNPQLETVDLKLVSLKLKIQQKPPQKKVKTIVRNFLNEKMT